MTNLIDSLQTNKKPLVWTCLFLLAVIAGFSMVIDTSHAHSWVEQHIPAFWSIFGFAAAIVIIAVSRWLGRSGLQVTEDYYECPKEKNNCEEDK